jgi:hypothetical protein
LIPAADLQNADPTTGEVSPPEFAMGPDSAATPHPRHTRQSHHHANRSTASQQRQTAIKSAPKAPSGEKCGLL